MNGSVASRAMTRTITGLAALAFGVAEGEPRVLQAFEGDGFGDWAVEGEGFGQAPIPGGVQGLNGELKNYADEGVACSARGGDGSTGQLLSPEFELDADYLVFLVAGGNHSGRTAVQLVAGEEVLAEATGRNALECRRVAWDLRPFSGCRARIRIVDRETGGWGFIAADHFVLTGDPNYKFPAPKRNGVVTGENLVASPDVPGLTLPEGTRARIVATHEGQGITSPTALAFDEDGALYVTETHRFRFGIEDDRDRLYWYLDDIASRTVEDRAKLLEKWEEKAPRDWMTAKSEVVRKLSGRDADGVYRESKVFADGFNDPLDGTLAGVFAFEDTVFLANIPKIYALRDADGNGVAEQRDVVEEGFGVRFSLSGHDMNGFALGPDGRLYGTIGDRGFNIETREGRMYEYPGEGAVFRFDPDGSNFEVIHTGLRNPKELAFDVHGNAISVDNNSDQGDEARVVYIVEGADSGWRMEHQAMHTFHRQIGIDDRPPGRWMEERMWETANPAQPAFLLPPVANLTSGPSGLTYHPGTGFLEQEVGRFLVCDYRGGAAASGIWSFAVEPAGAGMKMTAARRLNWGAGVTDVEYSWDGRVMVTDFMGGWTSHEDGRVYELEADSPYLAEAAAEVPGLVREGFDSRETAELVGLLSHPDMRVRLRAQLALTRRDDGLEALGRAAAEGEGLARLHGVWGLGIIARRGAAVYPGEGDGFTALPDREVRNKAYSVLLVLIGDGDAEVRAQAVKVLGESGIVGDRVNFGGLMQDSSARVRMFAAISAGRTGAVGSLPYVWQMLETNADRDPYLRHAGVHAMELLSQPEQLVALKSHRSASVRLAAVIALGRIGHVGVGDFVGDPDARVSDEAIRMIHDRAIEPVRPLVAKLLDGGAGEGRSLMMWFRLLHSAYRLGTGEQAGRVLRAALDRELPDRVRREALRLLAHWATPHPVDQSLGRWNPLPGRKPEVAREALQPQVEGLFGVEGRLLSAAMAVAESNRLDLAPLSDGRLRTMVLDFKLPGEARARALELYVGREPEGLESFLVELSGAADDALALTAIRRLAEAGAPEAVDAVRRAVRSESARRQQQAWKLAATIEGSAVSGLFVEALEALAQSEGRQPAAIELLDAARARPEAEIGKAVEAYDERIAASEDPLAEWNRALLGGDPARGRELYQSHPGGQCMRCHGGGGHGGDALAGPDLSGVANRGDRAYLLESLVNPGATVAPGFGVVVVTLKDGSTVGGNLAGESEESLEIDVAGERRRIERASIQQMSEPVSSMPPMGAILSPTEIRDLVAWLARNRKP